MLMEDKELDFNNEIVPVFVPLIDELAKLLGCGVERLPDRLNHPLYAQKVEHFLRWKRIRTTYTGKEGGKQDVSFHMLSTQSAHNLHAYEGYLQITVRQHYYCLHKIKLIYPFMKCLTEIGRNGHCKFYPLELLEVKLQHSTSIKQPTMVAAAPIKRTTILQRAKVDEEEEDGGLGRPLGKEDRRTTSTKKNWNDSGDESSEEEEEDEEELSTIFGTPPSNRDDDDPIAMLRKRENGEGGREVADKDDYDSIFEAFKNLN
jgi:hypothetical protein